MLDLKTMWAVVKPDPIPTRSRISTGSRRLGTSDRSDYRSAPSIKVASKTETRSAPRFVPDETLTTLLTDQGRRVNARIINVSASGVAVEADFSRIDRARVVMVGKRAVTAGRTMVHGTVYVFANPLRERICNTDLIL